MSGKKRDLSPGEKALWRRVAKTVTPMRAQTSQDEEDLIEPAPEAAAPIVKRVASAPSAKTHPPKKPSPPADRGAEKRVRRGKVSIDGSIDLHGHTLDSGRAALLRFLTSSHGRGARVVIVVTGKGRNKGVSGEGALKRALPGWLGAGELKGVIAGFAQAHREHGGAGAFYVFLKARKGEL